MPGCSITLRVLRRAGLFGLTLLLALGPFIHAHLGQPKQYGWHVHLQQTAPAIATTTGDALAQPAEPADVELAQSLAARRLAPALAALPDLAPALTAAPLPAARVLVAVAWANRPAPPLPRAGGGHLRPPPQAPPAFL